jgi:hypothetical protein
MPVFLDHIFQSSTYIPVGEDFDNLYSTGILSVIPATVIDFKSPALTFRDKLRIIISAVK